MRVALGLFRQEVKLGAQLHLAISFASHSCSGVADSPGLVCQKGRVREKGRDPLVKHDVGVCSPTPTSNPAWRKIGWSRTASGAGGAGVTPVRIHWAGLLKTAGSGF